MLLPIFSGVNKTAPSRMVRVDSKVLLLAQQHKVFHSTLSFSCNSFNLNYICCVISSIATQQAAQFAVCLVDNHTIWELPVVLHPALIYQIQYVANLRE